MWCSPAWRTGSEMLVRWCTRVTQSRRSRPLARRGVRAAPGASCRPGGSAGGAQPRARGGCRVLRGRGEGTLGSRAAAGVVVQSPQVNQEVIRGNALSYWVSGEGRSIFLITLSLLSCCFTCC